MESDVSSTTTDSDGGSFVARSQVDSTVDSEFYGGGTETDFCTSSAHIGGESSGATGEAESEVDSDLEELYESFEIEASLTEESGPTNASPLQAACHPPLYQDAPLTAYHSNLLLFQYALRHGLTNKAFTELLLLMSVHLPRGSKVPKSVHQLKRFFLETYPEAEAVRHFFCFYCQRPLVSHTSVCTGNGCPGGNSPAVFITVPLGPQIKRKLEG